MQASDSHLPFTDEQVVETMYRLLNAMGAVEEANILRRCRVRFKVGQYDNWNGGTYAIAMQVFVSPEVYAAVLSKKKTIESNLQSVLKAFASPHNENDQYSVELAPVAVNLPGRPDIEGPALSLRNKRLILGRLKSDNVRWYGNLEQVAFLDQVFDLESLPSNDSRFKTASEDIWQHTVNNDDWEISWIYSDDRFALATGPDGIFLGFLERMLDPSVRSSLDADGLAMLLNEYLTKDSWRLAKREILGEEERYRVAPWNPAASRSNTAIHKSALILSSSWLAQELQRIEGAIDADPALAIGTAKDAIDTCCKHVLDRLNQALLGKPDTPDLVKAVLTHLKLLPDDISDAAKGVETIKKTLRTLSTLPQGLAELRNLYGTGHGKGSQYRGLQARHARLAVGAAATFIEFITETMQERDRRSMAGTNSKA